MRKTIFLTMAFLLIAAPAFAFINGGFESGDLTGWIGGGGSWYGDETPPVNPSTYVGGTPNNTIVSVGADPITGASTVYGGNYAVRVNDNINDLSVSTISQSVVGYTAPTIFFAWNAVLEESHDLYDSDYFSLTLRDDTTSTDLVSRAYSSAGAIGAGTSGVTWTPYEAPAGIWGTWYSSGWVVESIDLAGLGIVGHNFTLSMLGSDCPYWGHAGYVYLDGFGAAPPTPGPTNGVPEPATLLSLGLGLAGLAGFRRLAK